MHCSNCNHHIEGKHSRCPECNFPTPQEITITNEKTKSLIHCHNCGTANEKERSRCCSCNISLQSDEAKEEKARTLELYPKLDKMLNKDMIAPYQLNGIQISKS